MEGGKVSLVERDLWPIVCVYHPGGGVVLALGFGGDVAWKSRWVGRAESHILFSLNEAFFLFQA